MRLVACDEGQLGLVRFLLNQKANIDIVYRHGETVLDVASEKNHHNIVKLLIIHGLEQYIEKNTALIRGVRPPQFKTETARFFNELAGVKIDTQSKIKAAKALLMVLKGERSADILREHRDGYTFGKELPNFYKYSAKHDLINDVPPSRHRMGS